MYLKTTGLVVNSEGSGQTPHSHTGVVCYASAQSPYLLIYRLKTFDECSYSDSDKIMSEII